MGKKRRCFLWAALLAFVMAVPSPGLACEHYNVSVFYDQLVPAGNRVEPQIGVPGYSGDLVCPECGQVCVRGFVMPALPEEAGHPVSTDAETAGGGTEQDAPEPQAPPETIPGETDGDGLKPPQPEEPMKPAGQDPPAQQNPPVGQEEPSGAGTEPEAPAAAQDPPAAEQEPAAPGAEEPAAQPEEPAAERETPAEEPAARIEAPPPGKEAEKPAEDRGAERPPQVREEAAPVPAPGKDGENESGETHAGGPGGTVKPPMAGEARTFDFSFRRTRFHPEPGIRAKAAGKLIWPVSTSPIR